MKPDTDCFLGAMTFSITTLSLMTFSITMKNCDTQDNYIQHYDSVVILSVVMLNVANKPFMLGVVMLVSVY